MSVSIYQKTNLFFGIIIFILGIIPLCVTSRSRIIAYDEAMKIHASTRAALTGGFILVQNTAVLIILFFIYVLMDFPEIFQRKQKSQPNETIDKV